MVVSRDMFQPVWKGYFPEELHVGHVTNGVHLPTWASSTIKSIYINHFKDTFFSDQSNTDIWSKIHDVADEERKLRMILKKIGRLYMNLEKDG